MEQLNNQQIVLLVLLVSFVTSIATGIVTVTLMQQVPSGITQTINRVVEKTVETVVPGETNIIVGDSLGENSDDLVKLIKSYTPSIVTVSSTSGLDRTGFVSSSEGHIITRATDLVAGERVDIFYQGGQHTATILDSDLDYGVSLLKLDSPGAPKISYVPLQAFEPEIGQDILILGKTGSGGMTAQEGFVLGIGGFGNPLLTANVYISESNTGGPVFSNEGILLGVSYYSDEASGSKIIPMSVLENLFESNGLALIDAGNQTASVIEAIDETQ